MCWMLPPPLPPGITPSRVTSPRCGAGWRCAPCAATWPGGWGGEPRQVLDEAGQALIAQARLQGEALQTIWREPMLEPKDAAVALGAKATNREKVRQFRERSWLLGLPSGRGYLYPAFQFDPDRRDVFAEVRTVNERLEAANDPWGVASWWISMHARLGARPADLAGTQRGDDLVAVAAAGAELIG